MPDDSPPDPGRLFVAHPDFQDNSINTRWLEAVLLPAFQAQQGR